MVDAHSVSKFEVELKPAVPWPSSSTKPGEEALEWVVVPEWTRVSMMTATEVWLIFRLTSGVI